MLTTEGWVNKEHGFTYAMCPGTLAGEFNPDLHAFTNFEYREIQTDLAAALRAMREVNPTIRVLLTVSPVPLTATASGEHVLTATTYSKSVLRAVAGEVSNKYSFVDYFPSYEIITAPAFRGMFYEPNMRSVHPDGVAFVMSSFFECLHSSGMADTSEPVREVAIAAPKRPKANRKNRVTPDEGEDEVVCEEMMLGAFGKK